MLTRFKISVIIYTMNLYHTLMSLLTVCGEGEFLVGIISFIKEGFCHYLERSLSVSSLIFL